MFKQDSPKKLHNISKIYQHSANIVDLNKIFRQSNIKKIKEIQKIKNEKNTTEVKKIKKINLRKKKENFRKV